LSYVAQGDPYPAQIRKTAFEVMRRLGLHEGIHWTLCWQSAVGPVKWMKPTTDDTIKKLCVNSVETLIVWPIAFVSDHIETLVEIDVEYAEMARNLGCKRFERIQNLNTDSDFIQMLSSFICKAGHDLRKTIETPLLRNLTQQPAGPYCSLQAGGCLCGNYYISGREQLKRGTSYARIDATTNSKFCNKQSGEQ
jgi:ferrochelatase